VDEPDPLWSLSLEDPAWTRARSVLMTRMTSASVSRQADERMLEAARALKDALDAELRGFRAFDSDSTPEPGA
jgi:cytochrome P450